MNKLFQFHYKKINVVNQDNFEEDLKECIICLETKFNNKLPKKIKSILHNNDCQCNDWIHNDCLELWLKKKLCCPLCKKKVMKSEFMHLFYKDDSYFDYLRGRYFIFVFLAGIYFSYLLIQSIIHDILYDKVIH